tara:strand:+ start:1775 stop:2287 length:513 start_codon:yes stop_codon:yes gene_type:complete
MTLWDFDENKNYTKIGDYKVLNLKDANKASKLLNDIDLLILRTFISIELNEKRTPEINLLLRTPYILQEMQIIEDQGYIKFEGLNKPKEVKRTGSINIGLDGKLRAKYRKIFLTLRNYNGKLKKIKDLKVLIAHELTHTAMNHVTWKDDNHGEEFEKYNKLILRYLLLNN